jgi:hypothetical protein
MAFLKTILIILLGYYLLKIVAKFFAPRLINYAAKKTESRFKEAFEGFNQVQQPQDEQVGDVIIDKKTEKRQRTGEKVGEYIDFEEID